MKSVVYICLLLILSPLVRAVTPIDGLYSSLFVGYAYLPDNIKATENSVYYSNIDYKPAYEAGGNFGYKGNPLRYEAELTYFNANTRHFSQNNVLQTNVGGYNNGVIGIANLLYDAPGLIANLSPFLGIGIGYAWLNVNLDTVAPSTLTNARITSTSFAYEGSTGITCNFSENYAIGISYRYVATPNDSNFGRTFQMHMANASVTYRYEIAQYK